MEHKDQKDADTAPEHQVDTSVEIADSDLDLVTGGVHGGSSVPVEPPVCITAIG